MPITPTRAALVAALFVVAAVAWRVADRDACRDRLRARFIAGVPWGTLVTVAVVVAFYLFVQSGLSHPESPVVYAFVSWSYLYPTGILTAGIAHGSAGHIVSNMAGTLVLAPIAEYVWSHYPRGARRGKRRGSNAGSARRVVTDGGSSGLRSRPWVRAVVVFPGVLLAVAFLTAAFSFGPGLGFSGALYAVVGFAVVARPLATVVGVVATSAAGTLFTALTDPLVRETLEAGPPAPPGWAGIGFQAHLLGFLIGVLLAVALLSARGDRPDAARVLSATLVVGTVQSLWLLAGGGGDEFVLYRGLGVTLLLWLVLVVTVAAAGSRRPLIDSVPLVGTSTGPSRLASAWLLLVAVAAAVAAVAVVAVEGPLAVGLGAIGLFATLLALPAVPALLPDRIHAGPLSRRGGATLVLVALTLLVSVPAVLPGLVVVDDPEITGSTGVDVRDYTVAYVADEPTPQSAVVDLGEGFFGGTTDGVVVTSDRREIWTLAERPAVLAHEGSATVVVGGVGWREEVAVDRVAWDVVGNGTAYAVDLTHDGETVRSYVGDPMRAEARIDGHEIGVVPTEDGFAVRADRGDDAPALVAVPDAGEEATLGELVVRTETVSDDGSEDADGDGSEDADGDGSGNADGDGSGNADGDGASEADSGEGDGLRIVVESGDTRVQVAERS
ncbi:rhomboid family intramembrane serine protease [Halorubrum sp. JWXQ-INN 858]|uniref:rhomboid family intramembrane serine protease n=1 Tax=Halorubrum sp. JWXQ-INN 858 TaxID=2690782 RepID=UPI00135952E2|nr:rhomboid family intramembrane serine protease [Halorubrum sp. JWXQ-INN 858]MWV64838.1 rhomboid family intramembrane serine protease [Halorubrum sp. JWXQ-INN 858]